MSPELNGTEQQLRELVHAEGEWTAMNIHLGGGIYTRGPGMPDRRLRRILQLALDAVPRPPCECRVLDLACLEGHYGIELAMHGMRQVVAVEGRTVNLKKAEFARKALGLENVEFVQDDVRNLARENYGSFDIVICSGILYHLDAPDVFDFARRMASVCEGIAIIDTYVSLADVKSFIWEGKQYWGREYREHSPSASAEEKSKDLWASIENVKSAWLTRPSLYNLLAEVGFTSVLECHVPPMRVGTTSDRITLLAIKRAGRAQVLSSPPTDELPQERWPEHQALCVHESQDWRIQARRKAARFLPRSLKETLKRGLHALGLLKPDLPLPWLQGEPGKR